MIRLVDIDQEIGMWNLEVGESQHNYAASSVVMLARAYIHQKLRSRAFWDF